MVRFLTIVCLLFVVLPANSQDEYFGKYFSEPDFTVQSSIDDRPKFRLNKVFGFEDPNTLHWIVPESTVVDGASIPKFAWSFVGGPMSGNYLHASIVHDHYCVTKERTAHDTHRNFYYGMKAKGVSNSKAKLMYWAVKTFGPSWKLERPPQHCAVNSKGVIVCESPRKPVLVTHQEVNFDELSAEQTRRIMDFSDAMESTLETSIGELAPNPCQECATLEVPATLNNLDEISASLLEEIGLSERIDR